MRIDRLGIELRPRPHSQALDLGCALLRAHAGDVFRTWLVLWLTAMALATALALLMPSLAAVWLLLPWWLRPALERGPLYVLSRGVFGERTTWRQGVRAWPGQLGGGMVRMLTWWRPFMAGRGLYQPVWQLEQARGKAAARRREVLSRNGTGTAAWLFGGACGTFETVLCVGTLAFISMFVPSNTSMNMFTGLGALGDGALADILLPAVALALAGAIVGPVYTACCFTLYLNRRAMLEAWDIELVLRRLQPPRRQGRGSAAVLQLLAAPLLALLCAATLAPPPAAAANPPNPPHAAAAPAGCKPTWITPPPPRGPVQSPAQAQLRAGLERLYDDPDLRGFACEEQWVLKNPGKPEPKQARPVDMPWLKNMAVLLKYFLIGAAVAAVAWLLYRYRDRLPGLPRLPERARATEVGGLDIRPDSLPDDVGAAARALWQAGERRAALALLFRATLSRLVSADGLHLYPGATEGDCLRLARQAHAAGQLGTARLAVADTITGLWLRGAYGGRWPADEPFGTACTAWENAFGRTAGAVA